jgi:hypothetical protein
LLASTSALAAESVMQLVDNSKISIDARYRFELVDQDNALRNAKAQTVRARINLQTGKWYGVSGLIEGDHVASLDNDRYNDTRNGKRPTHWWLTRRAAKSTRPCCARSQARHALSAASASTWTTSVLLVAWLAPERTDL